MKSSRMTPARLRLVLIGSILFMFVLAVAVTAYGNRVLSAYATEVSTAVADANASRDTLQRLESMRDKLTKNQDIVAKASQLMGKRASYDYQNQIIRDLNVYATRSNVIISGVTFSDLATSKTATADASNNTAAISITLASPLSYEAYLNFLHYVEQSLTQTQISDINILRDDQRPGMITSGALNLKVYIR